MDIKTIYLFIYDENNQYYRASQLHDGTYIITHNSLPYPIKYNPSNILKSQLEFATNKKYFSMARSINYPLDFIKDGAAILREKYLLGRGKEENLFLKIIEWNGADRFELSLNAKFDFSQKNDRPKTGTFSIPLVDDSAWGVLSRYDQVKFAIDCSPNNPKAVKVLVDGITLENTYTFQSIAAPMQGSFENEKTAHSVPLALINQDGDSSGIITKNSTYLSYNGAVPIPIPPVELQADFFQTMYPLNGFRVFGNYQFKYHNSYADPFVIYDLLVISFISSTGQRHDIFHYDQAGRMVNDAIYNANFDFTWNLASGEKVYFSAVYYNTVTITPIVSNIFIKTKTTTPSKVVYGLRAGDLVQDIVNKATKGRYSISSNFFNINNKSICLSGDALRQIPNAEIYSSFEDFFVTFDALNYMALRSINDQLWMEKATEVYKNGNVLIDLGEVIDIELNPANEFFCNEVEVGSPKQDLRHPSGRLEFNSVNTFSLNIQTSEEKLSIVTRYLTGCYDASFLMLDYQGGSTKDNSNDKKVYVFDITDQLGTAVDNIDNFENFDVDNAILEPIIKSPLANEFVSSSHPVIKGIAPVGSTVNIYSDNVFDGTTVADANGNWSHIIVNALSTFGGINTGEHTIDATFTDEAAPKSSVAIIVNNAIAIPLQIVYPRINDNLYNNKPLIKGKAAVGQNITIVIDGVQVNTTVADNSGNWEYKSAPLFSGNHLLEVNGNVSVSFNVDTNVQYPLITYIGSELDGFVVLNNLPLIEGVAKPFEKVTLWLNYISYTPLGSAFADALGNWSFQVVPVDYLDPLGSVVTLAPIKNGLNIISTDLVIKQVGINVTGFTLNRPAFSSITGVPDNTVFNTGFSPKRMLEARYPLFAAMLKNQPKEKLYFQTADKNPNLVTVLNNVTVSEREDVSVSKMGLPIAILEYANIKVVTKSTYIKTLQAFNNGGVIRFTYNGREMFGLCIGGMKISNIIDGVQQWKLLLSTLTSYNDLLNLYKTGLNITIMKNSIYHGDRNSLHFVEYDFQKNAKYQTINIYQDWFSNRNDFWSQNPYYIQKFQTSEIITDQIMTNGLANLTLKMYRCSDAFLVNSFTYQPVANSPVNAPNVLLEAQIDFSQFPEDRYFFVLQVGNLPVAISEKVHTKAFWPKTILIEASSSKNEVGAFFSTGFKTILRVEGIVKKDQANLDMVRSSDNLGNTSLLFGRMNKIKEIRFGTAYGLPDYLYLKIANSSTLDKFVVDNSSYVLNEEQGISKSDDVEGHPLFYYTMSVTETIESNGIIVAGAPAANTSGVILVVDPIAFGLPGGNLYNIELETE